ncbi:ElaB/YqjD/DUF883 family membrane-anchored ribosome-binding protein [Desulfitispora alkaliphila]|uniref:rRNA biogenesis protein rrp5 n=1 Tax=Desulfitispora alkaliphila TaxID=622674 RepID=UPI003D1EA2DE
MSGKTLEIVKDLRKLADSIEAFTKEQQNSEVERKPARTSKKLPALEEVRKKLAALSQNGKQKEVKELITSFGAKKLSDISEEKYPELLKKAGEL